MKTTIEIPDPLYRRAKIHAVEQGQTLRQVVVGALERDLQKESVEEAPAPYWSRRKLRPGFRKLAGSGALAPKPGDKSIDAMIDDIRDDRRE